MVYDHSPSTGERKTGRCQGLAASLAYMVGSRSVRDHLRNKVNILSELKLLQEGQGREGHKTLADSSRVAAAMTL